MVVKSGDNDVVTDKTAVTEEDSTLILELAAAVDENVFAKVIVLTEVAIERWHQPEPLRSRPTS